MAHILPDKPGNHWKHSLSEVGSSAKLLLLYNPQSYYRIVTSLLRKVIIAIRNDFIANLIYFLNSQDLEEEELHKVGSLRNREMGIAIQL